MKVFCVLFLRSDLGCVYPIARKHTGKILISVFSCGKCLLLPDLPSSLLVAFVSLGTASWIIPSGRVIVLCQVCSLSSQFSFIQCWFFPSCIIYPAVVSFTSCCPLGLLQYSHCNRLLKKKQKQKTLHFNLFCELCLFSELYCYHLLASSKQVVILLLQVFPKFIYLTPVIFEFLLWIMYWVMCMCFLMKGTERQIRKQITAIYCDVQNQKSSNTYSARTKGIFVG